MVILGAIPILGHLIMMISLARCESTRSPGLARRRGIWVYSYWFLLVNPISSAASGMFDPSQRSNSWVSVAICISRGFFSNSRCLFQVLIIRQPIRIDIICMLMQISRGIGNQQGNSSLYPVGIDPDAWYVYHSWAFRHSFENCRPFRDKVQDQLDSKAIVFTPDCQN